MSKTGDMLLKLAQQNPDVTIRGEMPISGAQRRLETTEGSDLVSQSTQAPESPLEAQFYQLWVMLGGPELKPQHKFEPMRRWRADFAHLGKRKVIIEIEGGIYSGGRHVRGVAFTSDAIKYNAAEMAGFHVIRLTSDMLNEQYIVGLIDWLNTD